MGWGIAGKGLLGLFSVSRTGRAFSLSRTLMTATGLGFVADSLGNEGRVRKAIGTGLTAIYNAASYVNKTMNDWNIPTMALVFGVGGFLLGSPITGFALAAATMALNYLKSESGQAFLQKYMPESKDTINHVVNNVSRFIPGLGSG